MTVFSVVSAWVDARFMELVPHGEQHVLFQQLQVEAGVKLLHTADKACRLEGNWDSVNKAHSLLTTVETALKKPLKKEWPRDCPELGKCTDLFRDQPAEPDSPGPNLALVVTKSSEKQLPQKAVKSNRSDVDIAAKQEPQESEIFKYEVQLEESDEHFEDEDESDEDEDVDLPTTISTRSRRSRGKIAVTLSSKAISANFDLNDIAVEPKESASKYLEMFKTSTAAQQLNRGRGRPPLESTTFLPKTLFVYTPRDPQDGETHNDPRFHGFMVTKVDTGADAPEYLDQFSHCVEQVLGRSTVNAKVKRENGDSGQTSDEQDEGNLDSDAEHEPKIQISDSSDNPVEAQCENNPHLVQNDISCMVVHLQGEFGCPKCDFVNSDKALVVTHLQSVHLIEDEQAEFSKALNNMVIELDNGIEGKQFGCPKCDFTTGERSGVASHLKRLHLKHRFVCTVCQHTFGTRSDVKKHIKRHRELHMCAACGIQYRDVRLLVRHLSSHREDYIKPLFPCHRCNKTFSTKYTLKQHIESVHKGNKKLFTCTVCGKNFTQKQNMLEHMNIHTDTRPYCCPVCGKGFHNHTSLKAHKVLHTEARNFMCQICGKTFRQRLSLKSHMKLHTGEANFPCEMCGKIFTQKQAVLRHQRTHTGERPFVCEFCGDSFNDKSILRRHLILVHKNYQPSRPYNQVLDHKGSSVSQCGSSDSDSHPRPNADIEAASVLSAMRTEQNVEEQDPNSNQTSQSLPATLTLPCYDDVHATVSTLSNPTFFDGPSQFEV